MSFSAHDPSAEWEMLSFESGPIWFYVRNVSISRTALNQSMASLTGHGNEMGGVHKKT